MKADMITLHVTAVIFGFVGILGALISISAVHLVWFRVLIAFPSLWLFFKLKNTSISVQRSQLWALFYTGAIVAAHWIFLFQSIKVSTVSVALVCISASTLFTALLEPMINGGRISKLEVITGLFIIVGIYLIFKFESTYTMGIIFGLAAALFGSLFSILNKKLVKATPPALITFYELFSAWIWVSLFLLVTNGFGSWLILKPSDLIYLLILGTICTSGAHVAINHVMKQLSAFTVLLVINLEPIYGILLAYLFFGQRELMTLGFYAGSALIMASVLLFPFLKRKLELVR